MVLPRLAPIHEWHIVISGFLQHEGRPSGMVALWRRLLRARSAPHARVELRAWNEHWSHLAELIRGTQADGAPPAIRLYGYSWGAGWGCMELARQLQRRGLRIRGMVLSDPVYRSPLAAFRWLAIAPWPVIEVPANVERVAWFRQTRSRPTGHDLRAADPRRTHIDPPVWDEASHLYMDELPAFHEAALRASRS